MGCTQSDGAKKDGASPEQAGHTAAGSAGPDRTQWKSHPYDPHPRMVTSPSSPVAGASKALCIGVSHFGSAGAVPGCATDVHNCARFLRRRGFGGGEIRMLTDDQQDPAGVPTRARVVESLDWLLDGARAGTSLFLYFSGRMAAVRDQRGGDELAIAPCDYRSAGVVRRGYLLSAVSRLPRGAALTVVCDCGEGGAAFDLPWRVGAGQRGGWDFSQTGAAPPRARVVLLHAAAAGGPHASGALSHSFFEAVDSKPSLCNGELLERVLSGMRSRLGAGCRPPAVSASYPLSLDDRFTLHAQAPPADPPDALPAGLPVSVHWYGSWYPARVRACKLDGAVDVDWEDDEGTSSLGVPVECVRSRPAAGGEMQWEACWDAGRRRHFWRHRVTGETTLRWDSVVRRK